MAKNGKLPKRIAGVKIPKKLRKRGGEFYAVLKNPIIAHVVAAGLIAAADRISKQPKVKKAGKATKDAAVDTAQAAESNVIDFTAILGTAAREGAKAIRKNAGI
ncbi:MAG: hypothetical protein HOP96_08985 [Sphingomonas sp.]|nr:hypothetical protein [Sphingomonas sp.]